jgi:hypothetical protein
VKKNLVFLQLALAVMPTFAANRTISYSGVNYIVNEDEATTCSIYGVDAAHSHVLEIPETIIEDGEEFVVTSIADHAFMSNTQITHVVIPETVTSIGGGAFAYCTNLVSVVLPSQLTRIENTTFHGCTSLSYIEIPESVTSIGQFAFGDCESLTSITLPSSLETIELIAFAECTNLESITIPASVTFIDHNAFNSCPSLTTVEILSEDITFGDDVWSNSNNIKNVYCLTDNLTASSSTAFTDAVYQNATLHIMARNENASLTMAPWSSFKNRQLYGVVAGIEDIEAAANNAATEVYNLKGIKVANSTENLPAGFYIVRQGSNVAKIAIK